VVAGGRIFGILEFYVIGTTAVAAVATALAVRLVRPSRLSVLRLVSSQMVAVSEPLDVRLDVENRARLPSPTVRIIEPATGADEARFHMAPLPGGSAAARSYRLHPARRGVLEIGPTLIEVSDALGLVRRRRMLDNRTSVIVHPPIEHLAWMRLPVGGDLSPPVEFRHRSLGLTSEEFDVLRPYAEGDDLRHIHWRATARLDEFYVRRFQPSRPGSMTVVIDTRPPGDAAAVQDHTTSVAASIVDAVLRAGDGARIVTTDGRGTSMLGRRHDIAAALDFLAMLEGGLPSIEGTATKGASVVVVVTASGDAIDNPSARHSLARRLGASLVVTHGAAQRNAGSPAADLEGRWIHLTGPGQLPGLWQMAAAAGRILPTRP